LVGAESITGMSMSRQKAVRSFAPPASVAFVHNFLDDYGLDPYEFRVYAHIVRRTGGKPDGVCFASLNRIGEVCKMSPRKAQQSIKALMSLGMLTQTKRRGHTDEYRVTPSTQWIEKLRPSKTIENQDTLESEQGPLDVSFEEMKALARDGIRDRLSAERIQLSIDNCNDSVNNNDNVISQLGF
jgi:hypothetical protein